MSSGELLDLIEFLPDDSATKTAERFGDWSQAEYRIARLINEIALMRYEQSGGQKPTLEMSPAQEHFKHEKDEWRVQRHADNSAQLHGR